MKKFITLPSLSSILILLNAQTSSFPISFTTTSKAYDGYIFLATLNAKDTHPNHYFMLDSKGNTVVDRSLPTALDGSITDFKPQPGNRFSFFNYGDYKYYVLDKDFNIIDMVSAKCDCLTDPHEFQITADNHYFLLATTHKFVDMTDSVPNGFGGTNITGLIIQEMDLSKNVLFEWNTFDHLAILDAQNQVMAASSLDYAHCNAIDIDSDTTLLLCSRHLNEVTRIDRRTGKIIWRMGKNARHNQFTFINDSFGFSYQHDARRLPNGNITLFDNGNHRGPTRYSRACEYKIDEKNMTATLVWEYRHSPDISSDFMGNVQRLPNGNTLIGWGGTYPTATEVDSAGNVVMELSFPNKSGYFSYRTFKSQLAVLPDFLATKNYTQDRAGLFIYPNPSQGSFMLQTGTQSTVSVAIYNDAGQIVWQKEVNERENICGLASGIYSATFVEKGKMNVRRFVVE